MNEPVTESRPRPRRPRPAPSRSRWANAPVTIRYGLPLVAVVFAVVWSLSLVETRSIRLSLADAADQPITRAKLEFFAFDDSSVAASPSAKLGELEVEGPGPWEVDSDLVPEVALVRVTADGYGRGFSHVEFGNRVNQMRLGAPVAVQGKIFEPDKRAAEGATVQAFGGGPHGVLVGEAVTTADGGFRIDGLSSSLAYVHLRVFREGCAVASDDAWFETDHEFELRLRFTSPVTGVIHPPPGLSVSGMRLLVDKVPGVTAEVALDGTFELDHLPPAPLHTRLVIPELPEHLTHRLTRVSAGDRGVELVIHRAAAIEGRVVDGESGDGVADVVVSHDHGPAGRQAVRTDQSGYFRIERVPPGEVVLHAVAESRSLGPGKSRRSYVRSGARRVAVTEGEDLDGIAIEVR